MLKHLQNRFVLLLLASFFSLSAFATIPKIYVKADATGSNNGTTWDDAYTSLQSALAVASSGQQIWVAAGTYKPSAYPVGCSTCNTDRNFTFQLRSGVSLYGGFAGTEALLSERNIANNPTILSGDIGMQNDTIDNVFNVVLGVFPSTGTHVTRLDGFTITGGNATSTNSIVASGLAFFANRGGGIRLMNGSHTLANNTIEYNFAGNGAGASIDKATTTVNNCKILNNKAAGTGAAGTGTGTGGGIEATRGTLTLSDNWIEANSSSRGGGVHASVSTLVVDKNYFFNNKASSTKPGGGLEMESPNFTVTNNTFKSNEAQSGGGVYSRVSKGAFTGNKFLYNSAAQGGGMQTESDTAFYINNTFGGNIATSSGGGAINTNSGVRNLVNNTFWNNSATSTGGALRLTAGSTTVVNNIFWGNKTGTSASTTAVGADFLPQATVTTFINNMMQLPSDNYFAGINPLGANPSGNIFAQDPLFTNTGASDFTLQSCSRAINAGNAAAWAATTLTIDAAGNTRPNGVVDMGAFEFTGTAPTGNANTIYVNAASTTPGNGKSWSCALSSLQDALAAAVAGDTIWVAKGTYKPSAYPVGYTSSNSRNRTFQLKDGVSLYGGFAGTETILSERNIANNPTILSGNIGDQNESYDNAYHVVLGVFANTTPKTRLDGFTIKDGNAVEETGSITFINGQLTRQTHGGGVYILRGTNVLANNTISYNEASGNGGGTYLQEGSNTLVYNTVRQNLAGVDGGGVCIQDGTNSIINNTVFLNTGSNGGGGIFIPSGINTVTNNTISYNASLLDGGGGITIGGQNTLTNNIFWGNTNENSTTLPGADYVTAGFTNNTLKNNVLQLPSSSYTLSDGGTFGIGTNASGNIFAQDPLFTNAAAGDFTLQAGSPAINAGDNAAWTATGLTTDAAGKSRPLGAVDMGAFENRTLFVKTGATGNNNGSSWTHAFTSLQDALAAAMPGDAIWVAAGTYKPSAYPSPCLDCSLDQDFTFQLKAGVSVFGGFAGTETALGQRNIANNPTILSGNNGSNMMNVYHVVLAVFADTTSSTRLDGFTISGGRAIDGPEGSTILVNGVSISKRAGGGMFIVGGKNIVANNIISDNLSVDYGGGIWAESGINTFINNTLSYNESGLGGAGISTTNGNNTFTNNTFSYNEASDHGAGVYNLNGTNKLTNNIFWGNQKNTEENVVGADIYNAGTFGTTSVTYCLLQENSFYANGTGNITGDPLFTNAEEGNFTLLSGSPAINTGSDVAWTATGLSTDGAGNIRPMGVVDMGAFEKELVLAVCQNQSVALDNLGAASLSPALLDNGSTGIGTLSFNVGGQTSLNYTCANVGTPISVTLTVTDGSGNTSTCTATVTVTDTTPPTVTCKPASVTLSSAGTGSITTANVFNNGGDNCSTLNQVNVAPNSFTCSNLGDNIVTLTVNDGNGNVASCTATVTVSSGFIGVCPTPTIVPTATVAGNNVTFNWQAGCYNKYRVQYRRTTPANASWATKLVNAPATSTVIAHPSAGTYRWGMVAGCSGISQFSTLTSGSNYTVGGVTPLMSANQGATVTANVFPNPAKNQLNVSVQPETPGTCLVRMYDSMGRVMVTKSFFAEGATTVQWPVDELINGIYYVQIVLAGQDPITKSVFITR